MAVIYQVDAFASALFRGNPAAVVILDRWMPDSILRDIAAENNLSETAFVVARAADVAIRWFTPTQEVPFCGHATLAAAHVLISERGARPPLTFATAVGPLLVTCESDRLLLDVPALPPIDVPSTREFTRLFPDGWCAVFRSFENLFFELESEEAVQRFEPPHAAIATLHPFGVAITARGASVDFVSRYFAPSYGILEDPVTGSTHATLAPYWSAKLGRRRLTATQLSRRGGMLTVDVVGDRVVLAGTAHTYLRGEIFVPVSAS